METNVPVWPLIGHHRRQWRQAAPFGRDHAVLTQPAEHIGQPLLGTPRVPVGRKEIRSLGETSQQRPLFQREVLRALAEIAARGKLDAPRAAAEKNRVKVKFENLGLAERVLHAGGEDHFADLALIRKILSHQQVLDDLLGDGRAALRPAGLGEITDEGANEAALVNAFMLVETLVLGGKEGLLHGLRNIGKRHPDAALVFLEYLGKRLAVAIEHHTRAGKLEAFEFVVIGKIRERLVVDIDHVGKIDRGRADPLVLAELPVSGLQVAEIDAAERLALARDGLGILHRGCNQFVKIDVLDVEGLAHMAATCAQELGYPGLIRQAVKSRRNLVRCGRHLTERQRSGKHLYQERFHEGLRREGAGEALTPWKARGPEACSVRLTP